MYGKRYLRILFMIVVLFTAVILVVLSNGYQFDDLIVKATNAANKNGKENHHGHSKESPKKQKPTFSGPSDSSGDSVADSVESSSSQRIFPISDDVLDPAKYVKSKLQTYFHGVYYKGQEALSGLSKTSQCNLLMVEDDVELSPQQFLEADLKLVMEQLGKNPLYARMLKSAKFKFKPKIPEDKQWFRFGGSSVWLPEFKVHYMVSRVLWTPTGIANKSYASFFYVQLFDEDWKEIKKELNIPYEKEITENIVNDFGKVEPKVLKRETAHRTANFPLVLPIDFDFCEHTLDGKYYWGPEDPRIILRRNPLGFDEPLIVFNLKDVKLIKRTMHMYLPFSDKYRVFVKRNEPYASVEKNWTPFLSLSSGQLERDGATHVNFMYSLEPLEVLTCDINTAICDFLQKPAKSDFDYFGALRGGTQLLELPLKNYLPKKVHDTFKFPANRKLYVGWARTHLTSCGCGESMYRPNLIILSEDYDPSVKKYSYRIRDVSQYFDFNALVPAWTKPHFDENGLLKILNPKPCEGRNVLIPNSIAYWDVNSVKIGDQVYNRDGTEKKDDVSDQNQNPRDQNHPQNQPRSQDITFDDYMGVTLSAADSDVSIVHVKGLLNYILKLPGLLEPDPQNAEFIKEIDTLNRQCSEAASYEYCKNYGKLHGG